MDKDNSGEVDIIITELAKRASPPDKNVENIKSVNAYLQAKIGSLEKEVEGHKEEIRNPSNVDRTKRAEIPRREEIPMRSQTKRIHSRCSVRNLEME